VAPGDVDADLEIPQLGLAHCSAACLHELEDPPADVEDLVEASAVGMNSPGQTMRGSDGSADQDSTPVSRPVATSKIGW
jgi:hypothetical protein